MTLDAAWAMIKTEIKGAHNYEREAYKNRKYGDHSSDPGGYIRPFLFAPSGIEFGFSCAHDIRTPLTSIVGSASGILENQKVLTQEREMELVQDIKDEAQWLIRIVENLLSVTRINGENARINTEDEVVEEIAVEDDGQGIKESVLPVIFEGKISSDEEKSDSKRNMGIGLSVCHSIVKAHKGGMHAENRAEGGARISFWLPMNEEDTDGY